MKLLRFGVRWVRAFGFEPRTFWFACRGLPSFVRDLIEFNSSNDRNPLPMPVLDMYPILGDRYTAAGTTSGHYFHQDLWAASQIFKAAPARHVDIGSRIDGFVAHLLVFRPVEVVDVRLLTSNIPGLKFLQSDATALREFGDNELESISSLHAAEHFGLGRFGDPVDPLACFKFMHSLARVLKQGGNLYFSVPVGSAERVEFNGHRIFSVDTVLQHFTGLRLAALHAIKDDGNLYLNASRDEFSSQRHACGLFHFTK